MSRLDWMAVRIFARPVLAILALLALVWFLPRGW